MALVPAAVPDVLPLVWANALAERSKPAATATLKIRMFIWVSHLYFWFCDNPVRLSEFHDEGLAPAIKSKAGEGEMRLTSRPPA